MRTLDSFEHMKKQESLSKEHSIDSYEDKLLHNETENILTIQNEEERQKRIRMAIEKLKKLKELTQWETT